MTGKERAETRLQELRNWQETFYANAKRPELSRQFKRFLKRKMDKQMKASLKKQLIATRRQKGRVGQPAGTGVILGDKMPLVA